MRELAATTLLYVKLGTRLTGAISRETLPHRGPLVITGRCPLMAGFGCSPRDDPEGETQGRGPLADGDRRGWGYGGSGPAQLALVILLTDASAAERFHQRSGASSRRSRRIAGCWTPAPSSAGSSRRGRTTSCAWRWRRVEHAPAAGGASAGGVSGASGDGGGGVPGLSDAVRHRRAAAAAGDVSGRAASPGLIPRRESILDPEDGTMTLRFIVGRILRELTADRSPHRRAGSARASARTGTSAC